MPPLPFADAGPGCRSVMNGSADPAAGSTVTTRKPWSRSSSRGEFIGARVPHSATNSRPRRPKASDWSPLRGDVGRAVAQRDVPGTAQRLLADGVEGPVGAQPQDAG